jgi:hypothetical protein
MIYEMLLQGANDLQTRWADLIDGLQTLDGAVPVSDPQHRTISTLISAAQAAANVVSPPTMVPANGALLSGQPPNIGSLIASTQALFNTSFTQFNQINIQASMILPTWLVADDGQVRAAAAIVQAQLNALGQLIQSGLQELVEITTPQGAQANLSNIRGSIGDIATYPLLTRDYGYGPTPANGNGGGTSSTTALGQVVQKALSDVLGRRPRLGDTRSFVAALNQSFTCKEVEGHTVCTWLERSYGGLSDLGGSITGAQASLYKRGREAFDSAVPLLDILDPLLTDTDPQEFEAARSLVRTEFTELINELGVEGGPRVRRVDDLFELLIGLGAANPPVLVRPFAVQPRKNRTGLIYDAGNADLFNAVGGGEVGHLGDVGGFERDFVNTIAEEQDLTNFIILRDYMRSLFDSWQTFRTAFLGGTDNFLGTQLVLLQRSLAVIAEQVDEIAFAMDSVFLGPAERQTVRIDFPTSVAPPMFVEELLSWVKSFASEEGPNIIQESGKHGVRSIVPTLQRLHDLTANIDGRIRHPGARHPRVQRTIDELVTQLDDATRLAGTIR